MSKTAQQSVHLTLGILRHFQAVFYTLAFLWLDGFAVPAPLVMPTLGGFKTWFAKMELKENWYEIYG
jgi:hypothetical protein